MQQGTALDRHELERLPVPLMLVSLGYSCQTRFIIDIMGEAANRRMPFDFNITSRAALLRAFESDGASLRQSVEEARIFTEPREAREGIEIGGMYFWHDYPLDEAKLRLRPDWRNDIGRVNEKYAALWQRFAALVRSDEPKTLFLSNTQHNLGQFSEGEIHFAEHFGLGRKAYDTLMATLEGFGARNCRLLFLSRSIRDVIETADVKIDRLDHRFAGKLSLRPQQAILSKVLAEKLQPVPDILIGSYERGARRLSYLTDRAALIEHVEVAGTAPVGLLTATGEGLVVAFEGRDQVFDVRADANGLAFSNGMKWSRD